LWHRCKVFFRILSSGEIGLLNDISFYKSELEYTSEPVAFDIMTGPASDKVQTVTVNWGK
jgi:hypothetical protein